jgi:DNA-binding MarR family transcriptional regulator
MSFHKLQLSKDERRVVRALARGGVMSPSQVSAETMILPGATVRLLQNLATMGVVLMRDDAESIDGQLVVLTTQARNLLAFEL